MSAYEFQGAQRFTKNLGDDVLTTSEVVHTEDGNAYSIIRPPPDENQLDMVAFGNQSISGRGPVTKVDCGQFKSAYHNALDHLRVKRFTCHLQGCPSCFRIWAKRQGASATGYLWAFAEGDTERGIPRHQLAHWVLSPPNEGDVNPVPVEDQDAEAQRVWKYLDKKLREVISTFASWDDTVVAVVRHPYRKRCPKCRRKIKDNKSFCIPCCSLAEWYWSPHLHVITSFHFAYEDSSRFVLWEAENKLIFSQKAVINDRDHLERCIVYELGHALYEPGKQKQAIRYLAYSAKTHFRTEITKIREDVYEEDPCDPNLHHVFYKIEDQLCDEIEPGVLRITKYNGHISYARGLGGSRIALQRTIYVYRLTPLGTRLNGRFTRLAPALHLPKPAKNKTWDTIAWRRKFLNL